MCCPQCRTTGVFATACTADTLLLLRVLQMYSKGVFRLCVLGQRVRLHVHKLDDYKLLYFSPVCCFEFCKNTHAAYTLCPIALSSHVMPSTTIFTSLSSSTSGVHVVDADVISHCSALMQSLKT